MVDSIGGVFVGLDLPRTKAAAEENACSVGWDRAYHLKFGRRRFLMLHIKLCWVLLGRDDDRYD